MTKTQIRSAQEYLASRGYNPGKPDGIYGEKTKQAIEKALTDRRPELPDGWELWPEKRLLTALIQLMCKDKDIEVGPIDGYWGQQTDYAFDVYRYIEKYGTRPSPWRDERPLDVNPNQWPEEKESELVRFYGERGKHQVRVELPYTHRLAWDLSIKVNSFYCHEKVRDSIRKVLTRVLNHYGMSGIRKFRLDRYGGCLNVRKKRGGTSWSAHAWGIAIDYDPDRNRLKWGRDRAAFARPEYDEWWRFWEEEGWVSLGRTANFDWMHVQAAKIL